MTLVRGRVDGLIGAADVVCSDGRAVVRTAADGSFELDAAGPFVFITTPTGFGADRWFAPVDGDLRFTLRPERQERPFTFVQVADLHLSVSGWVFEQPSISTPARFRELLDEIAVTQPDAAFIACTGDQTNDGTEDEYAAYGEVAAASPIRIVAIPGNHDHNSVDIDRAMQEGARYGPGVAYTPYDRFVGPRWFSFDHAGVHVVAIDWTTHHLGLEREVQEAWVRADLAEVADGVPVIFLTHDQMSTAFFDAVGCRPLATFSGHWHTSRVVGVEGTLHVNTPPATFGGLDYSAAAWRRITCSGRDVAVRTMPRGPSVRPTPQTSLLWSADLGGTTHRAGPVCAKDLVVVTTGDEDRGAGSVGTLDAATGERRWHVDLGSAVKATALVHDDLVVAVAVTGETVCVDLASGIERWRCEIDDPLRLWCYLRPVTDGNVVIVGDTPRLRALALADGATVWSRDDLGQRGNITSNAHPVISDGVLMVAFAAQFPDMWALDAATGTTLWPADATAASLYDMPSEALAHHIGRGPVSGFGHDTDSSDVYVSRLQNTVERLRVRDGTPVWSSAIEGWFNPATPLAAGDDLYVCQGDGTLRCLDRHDGTERWRTTVTTDAPRMMAPYRASGGALFGEPAVTDHHAVVACGDGRVVWLSRQTGAVEREVATGVPIVAAPAVDAERCVVAGIDGVVRALPLGA